MPGGWSSPLELAQCRVNRLLFSSTVVDEMLLRYLVICCSHGCRQAGYATLRWQDIAPSLFWSCLVMSFPWLHPHNSVWFKRCWQMTPGLKTYSMACTLFKKLKRCSWSIVFIYLLNEVYTVASHLLQRELRFPCCAWYTVALQAERVHFISVFHSWETWTSCI